MVHPNAIRSRKHLTGALIALMQEKPFSRITVGDITDRAQLSRRTFYRNFSTKAELLTACARGLMEEYIASVSSVVERPMREVVFVHLTFWSRHLAFLRALHREGMQFLLLESYNEFIAEVRDRAGSTRYTDLSSEDYALAFNAGGHLNIVFEWLRRGAVDTPEQVAETFDGLELR